MANTKILEEEKGDLNPTETIAEVADFSPQALPAGFKSGFVSIVGKPNVGKSTLLNALIGQKLAIVTPKPSTTRHRILGILNRPDAQLVFLDTPGVIQPHYRLHQAMMGAVDQAMKDAEVVIWVVAPEEPFPETELLARLKALKAPIVLAVNKMDESTQELILARIEALTAELPIQAAVAISALHGFNLEALLEAVLALLPQGPPYYGQDQLTDRPERFFVAEMIREKIFLHFGQEIPYSTEVTILQYEEEEKLIRIEGEIHVERQSQKAILIGKQGAALKRIGAEARVDIEAFLGRQVYLHLHVRLAEKWKENPRYLRSFGYTE